MTKERVLFGTDGIRGKANQYPMTGEVAFALGRAVTHYFQYNLKKHSGPVIVIGKDTRRSCYMLEQALSAGVCAQGGRVVLTGPLPTPGVAFVTASMRADAGVMISASHNSYEDNGIKIFAPGGLKLPDKTELELEKLILDQSIMPTKLGPDLGSAKRLDEVFGRYIVHLKQALPREYDMEGLKVVLDCANGAGYKVSPLVFNELGAELITNGVEPNGININLDCGSLHPKRVQQLVLENKADLGICLDGDADRLVVIDEKGEVVHGDSLIALFAKLLLDRGELKKGDTVVGTVMSNLGLERYIESLGLKFVRTDVGDRYVLNQMKNADLALGGETSGHIIFSRHATTGDGTLAAIKLVECMSFYDKKVSQLVSGVSMFPQLVKSAPVAKMPPLEEVLSLQKAVRAAEDKVGGNGRVVLRYSGTEPLARVMVEGENSDVVSSTCDDLLATITKELGV